MGDADATGWVLAPASGADAVLRLADARAPAVATAGAGAGAEATGADASTTRLAAMDACKKSRCTMATLPARAALATSDWSASSATSRWVSDLSALADAQVPP